MCTRPMHGFPLPGIKTENGKQKYVIRSSKTSAIDWNGKLLKNYVIFPCGKCKKCKLDKARQWAIRCSAESACYPENFTYFVTLTYDQVYLPITEWTDPISGEYIDTLPTLRKKDVQLFMNRLREHFDYHFSHRGVRFFGCGEYGDKYGRPHYHLILFNCPIHWLSGYNPNPVDWTDRGYPQYECSKLSDLWGKGRVTFSLSAPEACAYTARYTLKKAGLPGDGFKYQLKHRAKTDARYREYYHKCTEWDYIRKGFEQKLNNLLTVIKNSKDKGFSKSDFEDEIDYLQSQIASYTVPRPQNQENEFIMMSKKPGIGKLYFEKMWQQMYLTDECYASGKKTSIPKYFDAILETIDSDLMDKVRNDRHIKSELLRVMQEGDFKIDSWEDIYRRQEAIFDKISEIYERKDL